MSGSAQQSEPTNVTSDRPPRLCPNCQTALTGPYCAKCGQHDVDYHRSFYHLIHDVLENLFHFDGKFLVSVAWLLARPGKLTNEFNAGRRMSQVNPLRFYIFATVLFFLGVHLLNHGHLFDFDRRAADKLTLNAPNFDQAELARRIRDAAEKSGGKMDEKDLQELTDKIRVTTEKAKEAGAALAPVRQKKRELDDKDEPEEKGNNLRLDNNSRFVRGLKDKFASGELTFSRIVDEIEGRVPTLLFLGMPVFALLLKLLYIRGDRYYIEHLIFSLHLHTWVFLVLMVSNGYFKLAALGPSFLRSLLVLVFTVWLVWYVLAAFRTVYAQGWRKTLVKLVLLTGAYTMALGFLAMILVVGTVAWLAYS